MIVAIEGLIPDRRAGSKDNRSVPARNQPDIYRAAWLRQQQGETIDPQPGPALVEEEDEPNLAETEPAPGSAGDTPPTPETPSPIFDPSGFAKPTPHQRSLLLKTPESPFSIKKNRFARRR